jgi:long-chain acyl-CoA synthetase
VVVIHSDLLPGVRGAIPADATVIEVDTPPEVVAAYGLAPRGQTSPSALRWDEWLAQYPPLTDPFGEPPGAMIYTSGTTGRPKGVRRFAPDASQAAAAARLAATIYGLDGSDATPVALVTAPMYHSAPNAMGMNGLRAGATVVLQPKFDAEEALALIERWQVTHAYFAPIMFNRLLQLPEDVRRRYDLSSLRFAVHAAAPCPPAIKRAMIAWWGPVISEFYGSTEARAVTACSSAEWLARPGTVGKLLPGAVVRIVDAAGDDLPVGQPGEIVCGNPEFADFTYHGDEAKRRASDRGGLFAIGDIGYLDEAGYLHVCDRCSDMIISGGVNIYPAEIEAELARLPGVRDCAVFGIPDPDYGEAVMAVVQPAAGAILDAEELSARLRERLASFKIPRWIEPVADLPREDSGKILKRKLRDPYWSNEPRRI